MFLGFDRLDNCFVKNNENTKKSKKSFLLTILSFKKLKSFINKNKVFRFEVISNKYYLIEQWFPGSEIKVCSRLKVVGTTIGNQKF